MQLGQIDANDINRANALIERCDLPTRLKAPLPITDLMAAMQKDKKNRGGKLRFVSMEALGKAVTTDGVEAAMVKGLWKTVGAE